MNVQGISELHIEVMPLAAHQNKSESEKNPQQNLVNSGLHKDQETGSVPAGKVEQICVK